MPGVQVRRSRVLASADAAPFAAAVLGVAVPMLPNPAIRPLVRQPESIRGWARLKFHQQEDAISLATGAKDLEWVCAGGGKTAIALMALELMGAGVAIVVNRTIGLKNWARDAAWCGERRVAIIRGRGRNPSAVAQARRADRELEAIREAGGFACVTADLAAVLEADIANLIVVSWETFDAERSIEAEDGTEQMTGGQRLRELCGAAFDVAILDEHHKAKNWKTVRADAAEQLCKKAKAARWGLTATPMTDRRRDVFQQLAHIDPETWNSFCNVRPYPGADHISLAVAPDWKPRSSVRYLHGRYGNYGEWDDKGPHKAGTCNECDRNGTGRSAELAQRIAYRANARTRESLAAELPPKTRTIMHLPPELAMRAAGAGRGMRGREGRLAVSEDAKLATAAELAAEALISGGKVICIGNRNRWTVRAAAAIQKACHGVRRIRENLWLEIADEDANKRVVQCERYQAAKSPACLVSTIGKISETVNLHYTSRTIFAALPQTYLEVVQTEGRVNRLGGWAGEVIYIIAEGTIDEALDDALYSKIQFVIESGGDTLGSEFDPSRRPPSDEAVAAKIAEYLRRGAADIEGSYALGSSED